jgi:tetratricopeptide (TPR) repeat protein
VQASEPANVLRHPDAYGRWPAIEADTDNFRAAVRWGLEQRAVHSLAVLSWNLFPWYWQSGRLLEARDWLNEAVELVGPDTAPIDAARLWLWAGTARFQTGDLAGAEPLVSRATTTFADLGNETDAAVAQIMRTGVLIGSGRFGQVDDKLDGALKVMRSRGIDWGIGYAAFTLGSLAELRGDLADARSALEDALAAAKRIDLEPLQALAQIRLALLDLAQGAPGTTRRRLAAAAVILVRTRYLEGAGHAPTPPRLWPSKGTHGRRGGGSWGRRPDRASDYGCRSGRRCSRCMNPPVPQLRQAAASTLGPKAALQRALDGPVYGAGEDLSRQSRRSSISRRGVTLAKPVRTAALDLATGFPERIAGTCPGATADARSRARPAGTSEP